MGLTSTGQLTSGEQKHMGHLLLWPSQVWRQDQPRTQLWVPATPGTCGCRHGALASTGLRGHLAECLGQSPAPSGGHWEVALGPVRELWCGHTVWLEGVLVERKPVTLPASLHHRSVSCTHTRCIPPSGYPRSSRCPNAPPHPPAGRPGSSRRERPVLGGTVTSHCQTATHPFADAAWKAGGIPRQLVFCSKSGSAKSCRGHSRARRPPPGHSHRAARSDGGSQGPLPAVLCPCPSLTGASPGALCPGRLGTSARGPPPTASASRNRRFAPDVASGCQPVLVLHGCSGHIAFRTGPPGGGVPPPCVTVSSPHRAARSPWELPWGRAPVSP